METYQVIIFEYVLGFILQSFAIVFGIYVFNRQKIIVRNYIFASCIMSVLSCLVRLLPITIGVHTIINMLLLYLVCVIIMKMPAHRTIKSTSLCVVLIIFCEMIVTVTIMISNGKEQFNILMNNSLHRNYIGVTANVIFVLIVIIIFFILKKKGDNHRGASSQNC